MQQSAKKKAAPETGNLFAQVSLNLNLEKPVLTAAFQEEIEDVAHLLDDEDSSAHSCQPHEHSHD